MNQRYLLTAVLCLIFSGIASGASLPTGFSEQILASGLSSPTSFEFAPDGRIFVCEQGGRLRVIKNGALLAKPFITLSVDNSGERGLLGVTFDPNFAVNNYVYVYYTSTSPVSHNRVSRFTAQGDTAALSSESVLLDLDNLSATIHNGGAMHFGADGKLYIAVGENSVSSNSQSMTTLLGKILRINPDGSIPTDNPFYGSASGQNRLIWALGLRNPFTFSVQPSTGNIFINDVGQAAWEEIDYGIPGANYGWPATEGYTSNPAYVSPMYEYGHSGPADQTGCAITGGAFYNPATQQFPSTYTGDYFFADYCNGWIRIFEPADSSVRSFASAISSPVDLKVGSDGSLYYLARGSGASTGIVNKVIYTASLAPSITLEPSNLFVSEGSPASFSVAASGSAPLTYQWQRSGGNIGGATSPTYSIAAAQRTDSGVTFRCIVSNAYGKDTSSGAVLTVSPDQPPVATIVQPAHGSFYSGGDTIYYSGTGFDPEEGSLPASAFTWWIDFHHNTHHHPVMSPTSGITGGSLVIPRIGETSDTVWYRIYLTVTDSQGISRTDTTEIFPRKSTFTVATSPSGLQILVDGTGHTSPYAFIGVVGMQRNIQAVTPQVSGTQTFTFDSWSGGESAAFTLNMPATNASDTARYLASPVAPVLSSPANNSTGQPVSLTLLWTASSGAQSYRLQLSDTSTFGNLTIDDSTLSGTSRLVSGLSSARKYYWRVNAKNPGGTSAWSTVFNFTTVAPPDTTAPTVTLTSPASGATLSGSATLSATASDNVGVARVEFYVGASLSGTDSIAPYSISWNTSTVVNGTYAFSARAYDLSGNVRVSSNVSATVSNGGPDRWVYQDGALTSPWTNKSTGGTVNVFNSTDQVYQGTSSMKVTQGHWGSASFMNGDWGTAQTIDANQYQSIDFMIFAPIPLVNLSVGLSGIGTTYRGGPKPANQWISVSVPMSAMVTSTSLFTQFYINDANNNNSTIFYLDNIRFVPKVVAQPPLPPNLVSPLNNAVNQAVSLTLTWGASAGAATYRVQVSDSSTFPTFVVNDSTVSATSRLVSGLTNGKSYYWRVNAKNSSGTSAWSAVNTFRTIDLIPPAPVLASPVNNSLSQPLSHTLLWNASTGAATYRLQVSDTSAFTTRLVDDSTLSGTSRLVGGLLNSRTYYWRVNAKNAAGTGAWSATFNFKTADTIPAAPALLSPANNAANQPVSLTLAWGASPTAATYRVQVSDSSTFPTFVVNDSTVSATSRLVSGLTNGKSYFWRVNAKNSAGTSSWSAVYTFGTIDIIPAAPVLASPANNSLIQPLSLTLTWNPAAGAVTYRVQLSDTSAFTTRLVDDSTLSGTSRLVGGLLNSRTYYWRVNAKNAAGTGAWSSTFNFKTADTIPAAPALLSPANNAVNQPTSLTLAWGASPTAATYRVQLSDTSAFTTSVIDDSTLAATSRLASGLTNGKSYYWRVNAKNSAGTSSWSAVYTFRTIDIVPAAPVLASPANNALGQPLSLTLSWNAAAGALSYRLQLSDTATFATTAIDDSTISGTSRLVSGLAYAKKYYWRVNAKGSGGPGAWSSTFAFTTISQPDTTSPVVTLTSPTAGSTLAGTVTLSANASDNIAVSRVQFHLGTTLLGTDSIPPYTLSWNSATVTNGPYTFTGRGYDAAGNVGISSVINASVANISNDLWIYQEVALNAPWRDKSTGGTVNVVNSAERVYQGTSAIKVNQGHWGSVSFLNGDWGTAQPIDARLYQSIDFMIYSTVPLVNLSVGLSGIGTTYRGGPKPANQWISVSVPMSSMYTTTSIFTQFYINDANNNNSTIFYLDNIKFVRAPIQVTGVPYDPSVSLTRSMTGAPDHFDLSQNYPNPFNPSTTLSFSLPQSSRVSLTLYNAIGEVISTLIDEQWIREGEYRMSYNASHLASGVYFYRIVASGGTGADGSPANFTAVKRMLLVK